MVGPSIMSLAERDDMKTKLLHAFNEPVASGEHLMATWQYLGQHGLTSNGVRAEPPSSCSGPDLALWQREALDHIRAWKGRMQIYAAVFGQDSESLLAKVSGSVKIMVCCAKDDVLWPYFRNAKTIREDVVEAVIGGSNWSVDRDTGGIVRVWTPFLQ